MSFTLKQLQYLTALAETQHFGRAAAACYVSQPTLSQQIQLLEEQLGTTLIERDRKHLKFTQAGQAVLTRAQTMLQLQQEILHTAQATQGNPLDITLSLGVIPTIAPYWLPLLLPALHAQLPHLQLNIREDQTGRLLTLLAEGKIDCALLALPIELDGKLRTAELYEEPFWVALPSQHPLAQQETITLRDINPQELLLLDEGHCLRDHALDACKLALSTAGNAHVQASSLETLKQLVRQGLGITLLPAQATHNISSDIVLRPLAPAAQRTIGLVWRTTDPRHQTMQRLYESLSGVKAPFSLGHSHT